MYADVTASGEHARGCGCGLMVIIWAGIRDGPQSDNFSCGMGPGLVDYSALQGSRQILGGDLTASKEQVRPQSLLVPKYPGAGDANAMGWGWGLAFVLMQPSMVP